MSDEHLRALGRDAATGDIDAARQLLAARDRAGQCPFHAQSKGACTPCQAARDIDWGSVFTEEIGTKLEGATPTELAQLDVDLRRPISDDEMKILLTNLKKAKLEGSIDPSGWMLPDMPMPPSYRSLLSWSNGGDFRRESREFGFFGTANVREMLLGYSIPEWMPGAIPFAFDGGGTFYMFDMRRMPVDGEYPILFVHAGSLGYDADTCWRVAGGLLEACQGTTDPHDDRRGPQPDYPERADVWLVAEPKGGLKGLIALKNALKINESIGELKRAFDQIPAKLLHDVPFFPNAVLCARHIRQDPCLEVRVVDHPEMPIDVSVLGLTADEFRKRQQRRESSSSDPPLE